MSALIFERPALQGWDKVRREVGAAVVDNFFAFSSHSGRVLPIAHPRLHGVTVERDVPYADTGHPAHRLDVWRPLGKPGPLPVVFYVHGGGFRILSKDSHWLFGLLYARRGYLVVNVDYRLAPDAPFPAAVEDVALAWRWLAENAARLGADLSRVVVAGESAGANLVASLTLMATTRRDEPHAKQVFDLGLVPKAVVGACGLYEVSRPERFSHLPTFFRDRLEEVTDAYLRGVRLGSAAELELADPVVGIERALAFERPLPPFFLPCGTWDQLLVDTHRMHEALVRAGSSQSELKEYPRGPHAFHAFVFLPEARRCWRDTFAFLTRHLG